MLPSSNYTLDPNAEPFYSRPRQQVLFTHPNYYYYYYYFYYYARPCTFGFYPSTHPVNDEPTDPTHENVKTSSVGKRVWANGNWHKFCKTEWRVKGTEGTKKLLENGTAGWSFRRTIIPFPKTVEETETTSITTVMIRNIPNQFKFDDLLLILDEFCWQQNKNADDPGDWSKFDFVYLPMDYRKHAIQNRVSNLGYAFVNFTTPSAAFKFYENFHGLEWIVTENRKICEISVAQHQGKDTLMRIFQRKVFRCESRDFLPVVYSEGRDGLNRRIEGTYVGNYVWGLPRRTLGTCASFQNQ